MYLMSGPYHYHLNYRSVKLGNVLDCRLGYSHNADTRSSRLNSATSIAITASLKDIAKYMVDSSNRCKELYMLLKYPQKSQLGREGTVRMDNYKKLTLTTTDMKF